MPTHDKSSLELHEYISSEQFIHDDLVLRGEKFVRGLEKVWREQRCIKPMAISWPSEHLRASDGKLVTHMVMFDLDSIPVEQRRKHLEDFILRTKAYAVCLTEQREDAVWVLFESIKGSRIWRIPLERHGDVVVLGRPTAKDGELALGYLWRPSMAQA